MTNIENQTVIWKTYPEYPFIQANQFGEIRTLDHYVKGRNGSKRLVKGHVLKQYRDRGGYLLVQVRVNGKLINLRVHRVVASCFLPNPDNLPEVNHKDCNPKNNSVENLEWCTRQYNNAYKEKYGISAAEALGRPVFTVNLKTFEVSRFESQREAARQLGINFKNINNVLKKHRKTVGGYWFCYADEHAEEKIRARFGDEIAQKVKELVRENCN